MTGELALSGRVLKIGGVYEKTKAVRQEVVSHLIFPTENEADIQSLGLAKDHIDAITCVDNVPQLVQHIVEGGEEVDRIPPSLITAH